MHWQVGSLGHRLESRRSRSTLSRPREGELDESHEADLLSKEGEGVLENGLIVSSAGMSHRGRAHLGAKLRRVALKLANLPLVESPDEVLDPLPLGVLQLLQDGMLQLPSAD